VSLPFAPGEHRRIAVKIVDDRRHRESEGDGGGGMSLRIDIPREAIEAFCEKWQIVELAFFGSVLRDDFRPDSDIDVLVKFSPDAGHTLFDMVRMQEELKGIFGREVDLVSRKAIETSRNYLRRKAILSAAEVVYAA
jgi:hypothetical protein